MAYMPHTAWAASVYGMWQFGEGWAAQQQIEQGTERKAADGIGERDQSKMTEKRLAPSVP